MQQDPGLEADDEVRREAGVRLGFQLLLVRIHEFAHEPTQHLRGPPPGSIGHLPEIKIGFLRDGLGGPLQRLNAPVPPLPGLMQFSFPTTGPSPSQLPTQQLSLDARLWVDLGTVVFGAP